MKDKDEQIFHISAASRDWDYTITETKNYKAGGVAQLVECFLNMHKALGSIPGIVKEHGGTHYALVIQVGRQKQEVQEFKASLHHIVRYWLQDQPRIQETMSKPFVPTLQKKSYVFLLPSLMEYKRHWDRILFIYLFP